jgi:hypothetical protein
MTSYTLSPVWGAGAQLFDNSGNVLTGGKIETYEAGTTTNAVTYTNPIGSASNSNPIIADASGRLSNEIWLPVGTAYKFVLKDANNVLIATYDNIPSIPQPAIVNDASAISYEQGYTVTAGAFTVGATYLITSVGTTNFVGIGAAANVTGILFTATGVGSGNGTAEYSRTVQAKLRDTVSIKDFGAVGDGVVDDTAAIQAAINASDNVYFPPGNYKVTSKISVNTNNVNITGAGIGVAVLLNYGTDFILEIASLGGVSPTIIGGNLSDLEFDGRDVGKCVRLYDAAQINVSRIKCHDSTAEGIKAEQAIDCSFINCVSIDNATDGFALLDSTKNGVEFNTNAVQVYGCVTYGNIAAGLRITRSRSNVIIGGEYSANGYNIDIEGGERNSIFGSWIENATTRALRINSSTSPLGVLYSGNNNKIQDCLLSTGAGTIQVINGDGNFFESNYIGVNMTVDATATQTYIGQQAGVAGTITDNGSGTINLSNYTAQYYKIAGLKRYELNIGTNVDITSDLQAIRIAQIKGLSSTSVPANNFSNFVDISDVATTANITFGTAESTAAYGVLFGVWNVAGTPATGSESVFMTSRATTGFTINLRSAPGIGNTVRVQWMLVR